MNKQKFSAKYALWALAGIVVLVAFDQWTKHLATIYLEGKNPIPLIDGVLEFHFLEGGNTGAAWGLLNGHSWIFYVTTPILILAVMYLFYKLPQTKRALPVHVITVFIIAGAIGNLIDRIRLSSVIDFIYFKLINFPIFNVADIYVTVSTISLFILVLFYYKEADYDFLKKAKAE